MTARLDRRARAGKIPPMNEDQPPPKPKRGPPFGSQNAAKDDGLDATFTIRVKGSERDAYMKAKGKHGKLSTWIRQTLNKEAGHPPP